MEAPPNRVEDITSDHIRNAIDAYVLYRQNSYREHSLRWQQLDDKRKEELTGEFRNDFSKKAFSFCGYDGNKIPRMTFTIDIDNNTVTLVSLGIEYNMGRFIRTAAAIPHNFLYDVKEVMNHTTGKNMSTGVYVVLPGSNLLCKVTEVNGNSDPTNIDNFFTNSPSATLHSIAPRKRDITPEEVFSAMSGGRLTEEFGSPEELIEANTQQKSS